MQSTTNLDHASITPILDEFARMYARLAGRGGMHGILIIDQDAKVIAKNSMFGLKKPWDMGGIGAALYGVAKQASAYFNCSGMERVAIIFDTMKLFVHQVGTIELAPGKPPRDILFVILANKSVKEGLVIVQMRKYQPRIIDAITKSIQSMRLIELDERGVKDMLLGLQQESIGGIEGIGASGR